MKPTGYSLLSNTVRVQPDEGYCIACQKQSVMIVSITFDATIISYGGLSADIHEVSLYICNKCLQQIIDVCFNPSGYES